MVAPLKKCNAMRCVGDVILHRKAVADEHIYNDNNCYHYYFYYYRTIIALSLLLPYFIIGIMLLRHHYYYYHYYYQYYHYCNYVLHREAVAEEQLVVTLRAVVVPDLAYLRSYPYGCVLLFVFNGSL